MLEEMQKIPTDGESQHDVSRKQHSQQSIPGGTGTQQLLELAGKLIENVYLEKSGQFYQQIAHMFENEKHFNRQLNE